MRSLATALLMVACGAPGGAPDAPEAGGGGGSPTTASDTLEPPTQTTAPEPTGSSCRVETDWQGQGADEPDDSFERRTFDARGNLVLLEYVAFDPTFDHAYHYTWDEHDELLTDWFDDGIDGTIDLRSHYVNTYDDDGNLTAQEYYWRGDPEPITVTLFAWAPDGLPLVEYFDDGADGVIDLTTSWVWHPDGWLEEQELAWRNRVNALVRVNTSTWDEAGNMLTTAADADADGTIDETSAYTYDAGGYPVRLDSDYDADGVVDFTDTWAYVYDASGNPIRAAQDVGANGSEDYVWEYTWDLAGMLVGASFDYNPPDGVPDVRYAYVVELIPCE